MGSTRTSSSRAAGILLAVALVGALAASGYFALRALDQAADAAPPTSAPADATTTTTSTTVAPTTTSTTTTTVAPTTTSTTTPPPPSHRRGDEGAEVLALQQRLVALGFWIPTVDGTYGSITEQAVLAFQKVNGLGRDGIAGPNTLAALDTAQPVQAREGGNHIEVDLDRQLMFVVKDGQQWVFNTSTGRSGWRTPPGRFQITRAIDGMRHAPLGDLYRPRYFNGGIALHGSPSIPGHPASHGCTRLHDAAVDLIWEADLAPIGTPVWVY